MRTEILSEHPADMVADARDKRRRLVDERLAVVRELRDQRQRALLSGRLLEWVRLGFAVSGAKREAVRQHIASALPKAGEQKATAGRNAERRVADQLGSVLDDSWILLRGYLTARGEIDALLVGPRGVFAIEEKYWPVRVWIRGDSWTAVRVNKYGRTLGTRFAMKDGGGRSPGLQVVQPAAALSAWLRRNGRGTRVAPVVLLSHPSARIESLDQPTVRVERSVARLVRFIEGSSVALDPERRADIERLVRQDHAFHEGKRARS